MTEAEIKSIVLNHPVVAAGGHFIVNDVQKWMADAGAKRSCARVAQVLDIMCQDCILHKFESEDFGGKNQYIRRIPARPLLTKSWRTLSNEDILNEELIDGISHEELTAAKWLTTEEEFWARYTGGETAAVRPAFDEVCAGRARESDRGACAGAPAGHGADIHWRPGL